MSRLTAASPSSSTSRSPPRFAGRSPNTNTVLRALRDLRDEGLLEFRRGRGITVAGSPEQGALVARARELVRFARQHGYKTDELIRIIEDIG